MLGALDENKATKPGEDHRVIQDLDAIIHESRFIRLHGQTHEIKPVLVKEFFALANALALIKDIEASDKVTLDEVIDAYFSIIFPVIPSITKDDIRSCTHAQVAALMQTVLDHVNGRIEDEKKDSTDEDEGVRDPQQIKLEASEIIATASYYFGWRPQEILDMDAAIFFRVLKHGHKIHKRETNLFLANICDTMLIAQHAGNHKQVRNHFANAAFGIDANKRKALKLGDENTAAIVGAAMQSASQYMRVMQ